MPAQQFTVHLDQDDLAKINLAATRSARSATTAAPDTTTGTATHHGARDDRQAARSRSGRARAGRAAAASGGRSYAFRRS